MKDSTEKMIKYLFVKELTREYEETLKNGSLPTKVGYSKYVAFQCIKLKIPYEEISNIE